jgi:RHS repeat-associated protein
MHLQVGDHLGSTSMAIDYHSSEVVERTTYQPYGALESDYRPERWASFREDYKFTGKEEDIEVGATYFGARYYNAHLGRFMSPDPLTIHGMGADLNPYAYAVVSRLEPTGQGPAAQSGTGAAALAPTAEVVQTSTLVVTGAASRVAPNILSIAHWDRLLGGALYAPLSRLDWATLLRRTVDVDVKRCHGCGGRMTVRGSAPPSGLRTTTWLSGVPPPTWSQTSRGAATSKVSASFSSLPRPMRISKPSTTTVRYGLPCSP